MMATQHTTRARFRRATRRDETRGIRAAAPAGTAVATAAEVPDDEALFLCPDRDGCGFVPSER